ncbi:MAG: hydroxymethylbilane synthase [Solirubrobacteraceae bacterium]
MRIGTRGSALALTQARAVAQLLGGGEIVQIKTSGDLDTSSVKDKARWVDAIERALACGEIDLAVHSAKDLPSEMADGLELLGTPLREAVEDVLCGAGSLEELPQGARIGSSSLRRRAQLLAFRSDLEIVAISGNVDTRLRKLTDGQDVDAIVLAHAGLRRLQRESQIGAPLELGRFLPSPGQGALALQGRAQDEAVREAVAAITDPLSFCCLLAERSLAHELDADCHTPLGALAQPLGDRELLLRGWVGLPDGSQWIADELCGERSEPQALGSVLAQRMRSVGAAELMASAQEMAVEQL